MKWRPWLFVPILIAPAAVVASPAYITGKLVRIDTTQTAGASDFTLYVESGSEVYTVHVDQPAGSPSPWRVGDNLQFRPDGAVVSVRLPSGRKIHGVLEKSPRVSSAGENSLPPPSTSTEQCSRISALGSQYAPLASACQFALSRHDLPNYICDETMDRSANSRHLDTVTAEVTFLHDQGDRYSDFKVDGQPIQSRRDDPVGWWSLALFGTQLTTIFKPATATDFKFERIVKSVSGQSAIYGFRFSRKHNESFVMAGSRPGLSGTIVVDTGTGELQAVKAQLGDHSADLRVASYKSSLAYHEVDIPDLGNVLVPDDGQLDACMLNGECFRNLLSFRNCRKFGSTYKIFPADAPAIPAAQSPAISESAKPASAASAVAPTARHPGQPAPTDVRPAPPDILPHRSFMRM
jgi:hypothetical protein